MLLYIPVIFVIRVTIFCCGFIFVHDNNAVCDAADFSPLERVAELKPPRQPRMIPPYNGFGSEEDSLGNCLSLIPKPPQRDFVKFMAHDRRGLDSNEIRFTARLVTDVAVDKDRRFLVSYFRTDDTMLVFEPPVRNSGIRPRRPSTSYWSLWVP